MLHSPVRLAVAPDGILFIAEYSNRPARRVATDPTIETVTDTGDPGNAGDGGPGIEAQLHDPEHLALDAAGSLLFISDTANLILRDLAGATQL
jgi:hypothetical protein